MGICNRYPLNQENVIHNWEKLASEHT